MKLTKQQIDEMIEKYKSGITPLVLGYEYGIQNGSVVRIMRKNGIERNHRGKTLSQDECKRVCEDYLKNISSEVIAANLEVDGGTVRRVLAKNGITLRPATENKRKYVINDTFFEVINTQEKAYFLGILYADGSLSSKCNDIKIELQEDDRELLIKLSNIIYGFEKLYYEIKPITNGTSKLYTLLWTSQKMHSELCKLGCTLDKTFDMRFPTFLPDELLQHFIRGYFDGDGCISIQKDGRPRVDITSNYQFVCGMYEYVNNIIGIKTAKPYKHYPNKEQSSGNFQITSTSELIKFMEYIYKDASIFMKRKYDTYQEILKNQATKKSKRSEKINDISKYSFSYTVSYKGNKLTNSYVKELSNEQKQEAAKEVFNFYRANGFPYPVLNDDELIKDFCSLRKVDVSKYLEIKTIPIHNKAGIETFKHFNPHFWETTSAYSEKKNMIDTFNDDDLLLKVIENRLHYGYGITGSMIRQGLNTSKIAYKASIFSPVVAKTIYSTFCKENDIIYDYSMGFGQRLLGALSLPFSVKYVAVDPYDKSFNSNVNIFDFFNKNIPMLNKEVDLVCDGSENFCPDEYINKISLAFSSPPYFNLEVYENSDKQAYSNNKYVDFINIWWRKTISNISKMLKKDGVFALNITEYVDDFPILRDMSAVLEEVGLKQVDRYNIQLSTNTVFGNRKGKHKYEPILIFRR